MHSRNTDRLRDGWFCNGDGRWRYAWDMDLLVTEGFLVLVVVGQNWYNDFRSRALVIFRQVQYPEARFL